MFKDIEYIKNILLKNKMPDSMDSIIYDLHFNVLLVQNEWKLISIKKYLPENKWLIENRLPILSNFIDEELIKFFIEKGKNLYPFNTLVLINMKYINQEYRINSFLSLYKNIDNIISIILKYETNLQFYYFVVLARILVVPYNICILYNINKDINIIHKILPLLINILNKYYLPYPQYIYNDFNNINYCLENLMINLINYYDKNDIQFYIYELIEIEYQSKVKFNERLKQILYFIKNNYGADKYVFIY